jgi:hypothetical protein
MKINFTTYRKKNGDLMLFINRSNKLSVGVTEAGFSPYGKRTTNGQRNAFNAAIDVVHKHGQQFTGDLSKHDENGFCAPVECGPFTIVGTDVATIGGMSVNSDGGYVIHNGKILPQGEWFSE